MTMKTTLPRTTHPAQGATQTVQDIVAVLSGSWRGRLTDQNGAVESFNLERESDELRVPGQVFLFTTPRGIAAGLRLLEASEKSFAALIGPYYDPEHGAIVVTVLEGSADGHGLTGTFHTRRYHWRDTLRCGVFTATRAEQVSRAA
jgi:hypothetical protein